MLIGFLLAALVAVAWASALVLSDIRDTLREIEHWLLRRRDE